MKPQLLPFLFLSLLLVGCAMSKKVAKTEQPKTMRVDYNLPSVVPIENTIQLQEKNGIKISCVGNQFEASKQTRTTYRKLDPGLFIMNNQFPYEKTVTPYYTISPERIMFKIKVTNNLDHVLRLAGTVVSINVEGKMISLDKSDYDEFLQGIVLPRQEAEYTIFGPRTNTLNNPSTIGLFLYDMVTKTDAAGNPTERTNFEWYYQYKVENKSSQESYTVEEIKMTPEQARNVGAE